MSDVELQRSTVASVATSLRRGSQRSADLVEALLERTAEIDPHLNAFTVVLADAARQDARRLDAELAKGYDRGPLHGVPFAVKDLIDVTGVSTSASSRVREGHVASRDATTITRLRAAGAIPFAKAQTHEFAYGGLTPQTKNPWDLSRIAGGSSGGSAVAVAAGLSPFALGTDTAGSIRIPASCCGVVGLKPTYGRVSTFGVTPLSWSLDHVGPLARSVEDCAIILSVLAGYDDNDPRCVNVPGGDYLSNLDGGVAGLRVGIPENYFFDDCAACVVDAVTELAQELHRRGAALVPFHAPNTSSYEASEFTIVMAEASSYHREELERSAEKYGEHTRGLLNAGLKIPAVEYLGALQSRDVIRSRWLESFRDLDVVLAPTLPHAAPLAGQNTFTWARGHVEDVDSTLTRLNLPLNLAGLPSLSLRVGFDGHLPLGVQIIAGPFEEATALRVGKVVEEIVGAFSLGPLPRAWRDAR
ncbi:MAG TPA: amidase [Acidimicrobiales bacterium]|nr:amidase [Acidimicrobiales bacterium]